MWLEISPEPRRERLPHGNQRGYTCSASTHAAACASRSESRSPVPPLRRHPAPATPPGTRSSRHSVSIRRISERPTLPLATARAGTSAPRPLDQTLNPSATPSGQRDPAPGTQRARGRHPSPGEAGTPSCRLSPPRPRVQVFTRTCFPRPAATRPGRPASGLPGPGRHGAGPKRPDRPHSRPTRADAPHLRPRAAPCRQARRGSGLERPAARAAWRETQSGPQTPGARGMPGVVVRRCGVGSGTAEP